MWGARSILGRHMLHIFGSAPSRLPPVLSRAGTCRFVCAKYPAGVSLASRVGPACGTSSAHAGALGALHCWMLLLQPLLPCCVVVEPCPAVLHRHTCLSASPVGRVPAGSAATGHVDLTFHGCWCMGACLGDRSRVSLWQLTRVACQPAGTCGVGCFSPEAFKKVYALRCLHSSLLAVPVGGTCNPPCTHTCIISFNRFNTREDQHCVFAHIIMNGLRAKE